MAKKYSVSPIRRAGTQIFVATFRQASGARVTRSLETDLEIEARKICLSLVQLWTAGIKRADQIPVLMEVNSKAHALYFNESTKISDGGVAADVEDDAPLFPLVRRELEAYDVDMRETLFPIFLRLFKVQRDNARLREALAVAQRDLAHEISARANIEGSILNRAAQAAARVPAVPICLEQFKTHIFADTSKHNAKVVYGFAKKFVDALPSDRKTMVDVRIDDIATFIDAHVAKGEHDKRAGRRDALRRRVGRFVNWAARHFEYPSQMAQVKAVPKGEIRRERGDIVWHQLDDVEKVVKALPDDYWRAIVATLAYAGLQLAELIWLRVSDVNLETKNQIWVTTVDDPSDAKIRHLLKTDHRRRSVNIHATYLAPRLKAFKEAGHCGEHFFFAMPKSMEIRERKAGGAGERWLESTLSTILRGHPGGSNKKKRPPKAGILPEGMNAKTLRRTFGSLLLRSGRNYAEVAAAMGNTADVVAEHYARLSATETSVNF